MRSNGNTLKYTYKYLICPQQQEHNVFAVFSLHPYSDAIGGGTALYGMHLSKLYFYAV